MRLRDLFALFSLVSVVFLCLAGGLSHLQSEKLEQTLDSLDAIHEQLLIKFYRVEPFLHQGREKRLYYEMQPKSIDDSGFIVVGELAKLNKKFSEMGAEEWVLQNIILIINVKDFLDAKYSGDHDVDSLVKLREISLHNILRVRYMIAKFEESGASVYAQQVSQLSFLLDAAENHALAIPERAILTPNDLVEPYNNIHKKANEAIVNLEALTEGSNSQIAVSVFDHLKKMTEASQQMEEVILDYVELLDENDPSSDDFAENKAFIEEVENRLYTSEREIKQLLEKYRHEEALKATEMTNLHQKYFTYMTLFALLILVLLITWINRTIQQSFSHILTVSNEVAEGNFSGHLKKSRFAELQQLFNALNDMENSLVEKDQHIKGYVNKLDKAYYQIQRANQDLEDRVKTRTKELQKATAVAEASVKAKSQFLATMSHEIRTPMNGVLGMLYLISQSELNDTQRRHLRTATSSSKLLLTVINDILDFSKMEAGKITLEEVSMDPVGLVEDVGATLAHPAHKKGLELVLNIDAGVPRAMIGDPTRIRQVLINLMNNAVKFTEEGLIIVSVSQQDGWMQFEVVDSGIGIPPEKQKRVFTAFSQADDSHTRKFGGTGLGLAICVGILEEMGGSIHLESVVGEGSLFVFKIPLKGLPSLPDLRELPQPVQEKVLLLAEPQEATRELLKRVLSSWGINEVYQVGNTHLDITGEIGVEQIDVAMISSVCKTENGDNLIGALRKNESYKGMKIIELCTFDETDVSEAADVHLYKPISQSDLFDILVNIDSERFLATTAGTKFIDQLPWFGGKKLLLVEDNPTNQEVATEILKQMGFVIDIKENGRDAIAAVQKQAYDLVLMDVQMPIMDGLTATTKIRELGGEFIDLPIFAMTAHALAGDREKSFEAGMVEHITKPVDPTELYKKISKFLTPSERPPDGQPMVKQAPEDEVDDFPSLPGIDTADAVRRLSGNKLVYWRILRNFRDKHRDVIGQLKSLLDADKFEEARHISHSLKGGGANIGAAEFSDSAGELELLCATDTKSEALAALDRIEASLVTVLEGLDELDEIADRLNLLKEESPVEEGGDSESTLGEFDIEEALEEFEALLEQDIRRAKKLLLSIKSKVAGEECQTLLTDMEDALQRFDLKSVKQLLKTFPST